jgi:nucleoid-associated protein YgaU
MIAAAVLFIFSGCAMRTYEIQQDRPDQDLATGNRGRLKGDVPRDDIKGRKTTRQVKVLELELLPLQKSHSRSKAAPEPAAVSPQPPELSAAAVPVVQPADAVVPRVPVFEEYKVQDNDTLQKISLKYYGSINQWSRIYDANRDILRSPDSIYPKQTLKIPVTEKTK